MITDFSERILRLVSDPIPLSGTARIVSAIADARKFTESVPPSFSFTFYLNPNPQAMGSDPAVVFPRLLEQIEGWLGCFVHSVAYRLGQFLDDLITGMNAARPYRSVGAARGLVNCQPSFTTTQKFW